MIPVGTGQNGNRNRKTAINIRTRWCGGRVAARRTRVPRIGILNPGPSDNPAAGAFYKGLQELGYTERQNIAIERRYGEWNSNRFHQLAAELVRLNVDVIVVMSTSPARAAKQATSV
jgi:putative tryptophan/tyrosine transport system substrate-binding protein